jgi:aspartate aminotransferase
MTGWRIGFGAGPKTLTDAMAVVQSQSTSGASSVGQAAALAAYTGGLDFLAEQVAAYQLRRDMLVEALKNIGGLDVLEPQGGFFVFVRCAGLVGRSRPAWLLEEGVAGVAGSAYGLSPWFRLSIATATDSVAEAGRRIATACGKLQ